MDSSSGLLLLGLLVTLSLGQVLGLRQSGVGFFASGGNGLTAVDDRLVFGHTRVNHGHHYDRNTGEFSAPMDGLYSFTLNLLTERDRNVEAYIAVKPADRPAGSSTIFTTVRGSKTSSGSATINIDLKVGDKVGVSPSDLPAAFSPASSFSGVLVTPDAMTS